MLLGAVTRDQLALLGSVSQHQQPVN